MHRPAIFCAATIACLAGLIVTACYETDILPPTPSVRVGTTQAAAKQARPAGQRGRAELTLRAASTGDESATVAVGDTLTIEAYMDPGGDEVTGVVLLLSLDDTVLELVPDGVGSSGSLDPRPFEQGDFLGSDVYHNNTLDDEIGNSLANGLPLFQMRYVENVGSSPFGDPGVAITPGVVARFKVTVLAARSAEVHIDEVSKSGWEMGYFILEKPGVNHAFRRIDTFRVTPLIEPPVEDLSADRIELLVTLTSAGVPVEGAEILVSRSISGRTHDYAYTSVTNGEGRATLDLTGSDAGYYTIVAQSDDGSCLGSWSSVVVNPGKRYRLSYDIAP